MPFLKLLTPNIMRSLYGRVIFLKREREREREKVLTCLKSQLVSLYKKSRF